MTTISLARRALLLSALTLLAGCDQELVCAADQQACGDACAAIGTDPDNCGGCGIACAPGESCVSGSCTCPATACDGACVDLESDPANCGACGVACAGDQVCTTDDAGVTACAGACAGSFQQLCGRACVDRATNPWHCGECGRACGTNERCSGGRCLADLYLACFNTSELRGASAALEAAGIPLRADPGPVSLAWSSGVLFAASAAPGGSETLWAARFGAPGARIEPVVRTRIPQPDLQFVAEHEGLLYVSHSSVGSLLIVTGLGALVEEIPLSTSPAANPQGIAFVGSEAYVALNETGEVVVLDVSNVPACAAGTRSPPCATELARVDVQPLAAEDALARPSHLAVAGGRVFVALWNLDPYWSVPAGGTGRLAVIDPATRALDQTVSSGGTKGLVDLGAGCLNPADAAVHGTTLYVTCGAFDYSAWPEVTIQGAGIARVDLSGATPAVLAMLPAAAGSAPGSLAFCEGTGYVADRNSGQVFRLDPSAGAVDGAELCPPANGFAYVADLECGR